MYKKRRAHRHCSVETAQKNGALTDTAALSKRHKKGKNWTTMGDDEDSLFVITWWLLWRNRRSLCVVLSWIRGSGCITSVATGRLLWTQSKVWKEAWTKADCHEFSFSCVLFEMSAWLQRISLTQLFPPVSIHSIDSILTKCCIAWFPIWLGCQVSDMVILLVTAEEWLSLGLQSVGFGPIQQNRVDKTNLERFLAHFGASPETHSAIFSDLQTTQIEAARIAKPRISHFLIYQEQRSRRERGYWLNKKWNNKWNLYLHNLRYYSNVICIDDSLLVYRLVYNIVSNLETCFTMTFIRPISNLEQLGIPP